MGLRPNGELQDPAGESVGGFSRRVAMDNIEEGTKSCGGGGACVRTRGDLVAASNRPMGWRWSLFHKCRSPELI